MSRALVTPLRTHRREVVKHVAPRYRQASFAQKSLLLDRVVEATGYARKYVIGLLNHASEKTQTIPLVHILPRPTRQLAAIVGNILPSGIQHPAGNVGVTRGQKTQHPALWCPKSCRKCGCHTIAHREHSAIGDGTSCLP